MDKHFLQTTNMSVSINSMWQRNGSSFTVSKEGSSLKEWGGVQKPLKARRHMTSPPEDQICSEPIMAASGAEAAVATQHVKADSPP